ncbi:hypothetical protein NVP1170O_102 [Vibrio phage 1.170.O._10N.261.52.C3]|nr:hypothetical protein NVP1170O_102 [Vibrio phage 1.170.O._10N.261.52.C3]
MASKLLKNKINLAKTLRDAEKGSVLYLELSEGVSFSDVMKNVASYSTKHKVKVKQTAFKGLSNEDQIIKICKVEIL